MTLASAERPTLERPTPLAFEAVKGKLWSTPFRVRFGQCDPAGIVYTPNFYDIYNVVLEDWYREALGLDYYSYIAERNTGLGYVNVNGDFFTPCRMGDVLQIAVAVEHVGNSSFVVVLHTFREGREASRGRLTVVTTDIEASRPRPIPDDLRQALLAYTHS